MEFIIKASIGLGVAFLLGMGVLWVGQHMSVSFNAPAAQVAAPMPAPAPVNVPQSRVNRPETLPANNQDEALADGACKNGEFHLKNLGCVPMSSLPDPKGAVERMAANCHTQGGSFMWGDNKCLFNGKQQDSVETDHIKEYPWLCEGIDGIYSQRLERCIPR